MKLGDKFKTDYNIRYIIFGPGVPPTEEVSDQVYGHIIKIDEKKKQIYLKDPRDPDWTAIISFDDFMKKNKFSNRHESVIEVLIRRIIREERQRLKESTFSFDKIIPGKTRIEFIVPGQTSKTSTGLVIDKDSNRSQDFLVVRDDKSKRQMNIFMQNVANIIESKLEELSTEDEITDLATNLLDFMGGSIDNLPNWRADQRIVKYFRESSISGNLASKVYQRALELSQDNKPKTNRKYLDN